MSVAMRLLQIAAELAPPFARFLEHAAASAPDEHSSVADEVRSILPARSETRKALDELEPKETDR